jgi:tryptophan-rich sensory protein
MIKDIISLIVAVGVSLLAGVIGSFFTFNSIQDWYQFLEKPALNPPNWIFGPVWTLLYILMGVALFLVWKKGWKNKKVKIAINIFFIQLTLNALWSILFFGLQNPLLAFVEIIILWILIVVTMEKFYHISKPAMYLLIPYLLWVSFASYLNASIWLLN